MRRVTRFQAQGNFMTRIQRVYLSRSGVMTAALLCLLIPSAVVACLWDYDTIKMERSQFPGTLELITGKFLRHTFEFYEWRINDRLRRLESEPANVSLLDDLAVAYDKTGQHDLAIETAVKTEELQPGRYETAANLGTFYIHAGKLEDGLPHLKRAMEINPEAHFGREKYQQLLVEYVLHCRKNGRSKPPLAKVKVYDTTVSRSPSASEAMIEDTFEQFLRQKPNEPLSAEAASAAVNGVLGMMKFGKHDSPILLEALGTLLARDVNRPRHDAKLLSARAFLKASYEVSDESAQVAYRAMAAQALSMQTPPGVMDQIPLEEVEADFKRELADGRAWFNRLHETERSWIREGRNPEAEFDRLYAVAPEVPGMDVVDPLPPIERMRRNFIAFAITLAVVIVSALVGAVYVIYRRWRRRSTATVSLPCEDIAQSS